MTLYFGIFGVGRIGRVHASIVLEQGHTIFALGDEVAAATDLARKELQLLAVAAFESPEAMVTGVGDRLDAVVIASHTKDHARHALPFVQAGIPVYLEKPLTDGLVEAFDFVDIPQGYVELDIFAQVHRRPNKCLIARGCLLESLGIQYSCRRIAVGFSIDDCEAISRPEVPPRLHLVFSGELKTVSYSLADVFQSLGRQDRRWQGADGGRLLDGL